LEEKRTPLKKERAWGKGKLQVGERSHRQKKGAVMGKK